MTIINRTSQDIEVWIGDDHSFFVGCSTSDLPKWQICSGKLEPVIPEEKPGVILVVSPSIRSALRSRKDLRTNKEIIMSLTNNMFSKDGIYATHFE